MRRTSIKISNNLSYINDFKSSNLILRWFDDTIQKLKTVTLFGKLAQLRFLSQYPFFMHFTNLIATCGRAAHFELSTNGTSFGLIYLSGWVGMLVSLIGIMLISMVISFVSESRFVHILGNTYWTYHSRLRNEIPARWRLEIFIDNAEMINSLALFYDKICYNLSLSFGVLR